MPSVGVSSRLISVPAQNSAAWTQRTADITDYIGYKARLLILYQSGTSFTGDIQLDDFSIGGNTFDPETGVNGFEKQTVVDNSKISSGNLDNIQTDYNAISWTGIGSSTSAFGFFVRDGFGTPSGSTGLTSGNTGSYYFYAETSSVGSNNDIWLRSPELTILNNSLSFYTAQSGATSGPIYAYLVVSSAEIYGDEVTPNIEYSALTLDHMDRWGPLDGWNFGPLDGITQLDVWQGVASINTAITSTGIASSVVPASASASISATVSQADSTKITTAAGSVATSVTSAATPQAIKSFSAAVSGAASVSASCRFTASFSATVAISVAASSSAQKISTIAATASVSATGSASFVSVLAVSSSANIVLNSDSYQSITYSFSSSELLSLSGQSVAKIIGDDWSDVQVGSEVWSDISVGSEVWSQVPLTSNQNWAAQ